MMSLFRMECRKIAGSILYGVLVLALLAVTLFQYDPSVESELRRTNDPSSVFYTADSYAPERGAPDEAMEQNMMKEAAKLLLYNYRDNGYLYYPFGYVKEKVMSAEEQAVILQYLTELTGLSEQALNRMAITLAALVLVGLAVLIYGRKRKGGLTFGNQKSTHHHKFKLTA